MPRMVLPPVFRALGAQLAVLPITLLLVGVAPLLRGLWTAALLQGTLAVLLSQRWKLGLGWRLFQALLPLALATQLVKPLPGWIFLLMLGLLLLVFGGGVRTRVPLYNSNRAAWASLADQMPQGPFVFVDLGAGLGGPLAFLARRFPEARFRGVEASLLVWLVAWLRTRPKGVDLRLGSLWNEPLADVDVAYAFLSPAPMADLWEKVCAEMRPGSLLVSHSFEVPGVVPEAHVPLSGRPGACLRLYRVPGMMRT